MKHRRGAALLAVLAAATACTPGKVVTRLSIATGGTGGVYYPLGGALAQVITRHLPGVEATAEVTAASVDNLKFLRAREADLGFVLADSLADAVAGQGAFSEGGPVAARALALLYTNHTHVVVRPGVKVAGLAELRGRVVSTGSPGSGTEVLALRLLEAAGLDPDDDLRRESLGAAASAGAVKDGKLDAFFWSGGLPTGAVLDLAHTQGELHLLPTAPLIPHLRERHGADLYLPSVISAATYPGLEGDVAVVGVPNVLVVHAAMPEQMAYDVTRLLFDKKGELEAVHAAARQIVIEKAYGRAPAPFHPGAERFYRERGVRAP